jgi:hypothetical protein
MKYYIGQKVWIPSSLTYKTIVDIENFDNTTLLYMNDLTAYPTTHVIIDEKSCDGEPTLEEFLSFVIIRDILENNSQDDLDNIFENTFGIIGKKN